MAKDTKLKEILTLKEKEWIVENLGVAIPTMGDLCILREHQKEHPEYWEGHSTLVSTNAGSDYDIDKTRTEDELDFDKICLINKERIFRLVEMGVLEDNLGINSEVRGGNKGKSNYAAANVLMQPWSIWCDWEHLTAWDKDIIKRIFRTKEEGGMSIEEARIMDYEKIIHNATERIRQIRMKILLKKRKE